MSQAVVYKKREMIVPPGRDPRCATCEHTATWVVDLGSRRVIRGVCATCTETRIPREERSNLDSRR